MGRRSKGRLALAKWKHEALMYCRDRQTGGTPEQRTTSDKTGTKQHSTSVKDDTVNTGANRSLDHVHAQNNANGHSAIRRWAA